MPESSETVPGPGSLPSPTDSPGARPASRQWSPMRAVVGFGLVSLAADAVYEGARSVTGPLLASLGASALLVGLVTGLGEAMALILRLPFGARVDRSGGYWRMTVVGYAMTAVCVPLLAVTPFIGAAGLGVGCLLILAERAGKAIRSPAKSTLLAHAAGPLQGRGFGIHKALDQVGAFAGPLLVAGIAAGTGQLWPALAVLAVPAAVSMVLLGRLRRATGDPLRAAALAREPGSPRRSLLSQGRDLPRAFWLFAATTALTTAGLVTFGVISYRLVTDGVVPTAVVPVVYAAAMAVAAVAALVVGALYDRHGGRVLTVLPLLVAAVPPLAFADAWAPAVLGVLLWGAAVGLQDSTVKALVARLVPPGRRGTGYGMFAAVQGTAAIAGGAVAGYLSARSVPALVVVVAVLQVAALVLLARTLRSGGEGGPPGADSQHP